MPSRPVQARRPQSSFEPVTGSRTPPSPPRTRPRTTASGQGRPPRRRGLRVLRRIVVTLVVFACLVVGGALAVAKLLGGDEPAPQVQRCAATLEGTDWYLTPEQADVAALVAGRALARDLPPRALTIALATALQESDLANIDYGDRDSLGVFQQRPSQGWGTPEQILDPVYSTNTFYDALVKVEGYQDMAVTEAAQAVQRSAFPDAYAQHETRSRAWANALYGFARGAVRCQLDGDEPGPVDPAAVAARVERDLGLTATVTPDGVLVDATPLAPNDPELAARLAWGVAHWAVAAASATGVVGVEHEGLAWERGPVWHPRPEDAAPLPASTVLLRLPAAEG
jgi:hypothetical protein